MLGSHRKGPKQQKEKDAGYKKGKTGKGKTQKGRTNEDASGLTVERLQSENDKLREELERERNDRNFFQAESQRVHTFWEITKRELEERNCTLRNVQAAVDESEEAHQKEIKVFKQKVKHLLNEHKIHIDELNAGNVTALQLAVDQHRMENLEIRKEKRALKEELKLQQLAHEEFVKSMKKVHSEGLTALTGEHERREMELEAKYQEKMEQLTAELQLRRKTELHELKERKNTQICTLMKNHEKALHDMKMYYNDITTNSMGLINALKDKVDELSKRNDQLQRRLNELLSENRSLSENLSRSQGEVSTMKQRTAEFNNNKNILESTKRQLTHTNEQLRTAELKNEIMQQRHIKLEQEKQEIYLNFTKAIHEVHQKSSFKNQLLEKKLRASSDVLEMREAQMNELAAAANVDPSSAATRARRLEEIINAKNRAIRDLQYEVARVCKSHNDLMHAYEARLEKFDIRPEETGFTPMTSKVKSQVLGKGPSGLVSTPN